MTTRRAQASLPGLEDPERKGVIHDSARTLPTAPCPECGAAVILARCVNSWDGDVALDPGPNVFLVHGECADGRPQVFKTGNGLAQHVCGEK